MRDYCARQGESWVYSGDAVVFNVPSKRSWFSVDFCPAWPMWNHVNKRPVPLQPGHSSSSRQGTHPPPARALIPLQPNLGAQSRICGYEIVYVSNVPYSSSSNTVSWNTPQMVYPCSIDCYYLLG
jgi:hypothetical protein